VKKINVWIVVVITTIFISACSVFPLVTGPRVAGNLVGEWPEGSRLALVSLTDAGDINYSNQTQIVDPNVFDGYLFDLPDPAAEGVYQIVGYMDSNQNSLFDENEVVATTNSKYLIYARMDTQIAFLGQTVVVRRGWNGYELSRASTPESPNPFQVATYGDYNLFLQ
jgi:hypothetical protein